MWSYFRLVEVFSKVVFLYASRKLLIQSPSRGSLVIMKEFIWWTLFHVISLPRGEGPISFMFSRSTRDVYIPQRVVLSYAPQGWSSLLASRQIPTTPQSPYFILLLSKRCPSRCVTFFTKLTSFLGKCASFLLQCCQAHLSSVFVSCSLRGSHFRCIWSTISYNPLALWTHRAARWSVIFI